MIGFANCLFVLLWNRTNIYNYLLFHDIDFSHVVFIRNWSGHIYDLRKIPLLAAFLWGFISWIINYYCYGDLPIYDWI
ncbi:hypothetical protein AAHH67_22085 [Niallia circulans]